ncbi:MAG TPA: D-alanine--D-alanine ligase [Myxococcales bacterium]|nr:D-alanine--D-alanine ligase [Myxococcales bacterium]HAN30596.1 D-alanine--D-alanine ligase [Myxococcales bacterium]
MEHRSIAVLHGGPSSEHDISVISAREVLNSLRGGGYTALSVWVDRQGLWHFAGAQAPSGSSVADPLCLPEALARLRDEDVLCAFLGFHGTYGEDGRVQAALELAGVPYTGSKVTASALAMDKPLARRILASAGVRVPAGRDLVSSDVLGNEAHVAQELVTEFGLPLVLKVSAGGSSLGVEIPNTLAEVQGALSRLAADTQILLCEQFIIGKELTAGVLSRIDGQLEALPAVEIAPKGEGFFDYEAKYDPSLTDEICPARISEHVENKCRHIGVLAHRALGCRGISRTDLILDEQDQLWVLETNTLPGLTPASLLPKSAAAVGCSYLQLLERIVATAKLP